MKKIMAFINHLKEMEVQRDKLQNECLYSFSTADDLKNLYEKNQQLARELGIVHVIESKSTNEYKVLVKNHLYEESKKELPSTTIQLVDRDDAKEKYMHEVVIGNVTLVTIYRHAIEKQNEFENVQQNNAESFSITNVNYKGIDQKSFNSKQRRNDYER